MENKWAQYGCVSSVSTDADGNDMMTHRLQLKKPSGESHKLKDIKPVKGASQLKICVEKNLPHHEHIHSHLRAMSTSEEHHQRLRAAFIKTKLWNPRTDKIVISFEESPSDEIRWRPPEEIAQQLRMNGQPDKPDPLSWEVMEMDKIEAIKKIVRERIMPIAGLDIRFAEDGERGNVRVGFQPGGGAHSLVGTDNKHSDSPTTMNFGWLDVGTILHEFCHMLGMIHEHQNPKGATINWDKPAVYSWACSTQGWDPTITYSNIIEKMSVDHLNATQFDPHSIMLYAYPAELTTDHKSTQFNVRLSPTDVKFINDMYPDSELTPKQFFDKYYSDSAYDPTPIPPPKRQGASFMTWLIVITVVALAVALVLIL